MGKPLVEEGLDAFHLCIQYQLDSHGLYQGHIALNSHAADTEVWNDMADNPTRRVPPFQYRYVGSGAAQIVGGRQACRTAAHHGYLHAGDGGAGLELRQEPVESVFGGLELDGTDMNRLLNAGAHALVLAPMGTDGAGDKG